ncbi:MAG: RHS repeat-associated core domain-containing protein [Cellulosilyticaceae bacterium]
MVTGHGVVAANINGMDNSYYYHQDEQGSTAIITDENADIKNSYHYDAFGKILESQEELPNRITYTGQQYDPLTQQYYLRARYYNPIIGRFNQEDTYRGDGLNLYAYCSNNPVSYYDPTGYAKQASPPCKAPAVTDADGGDTKGAAKADLVYETQASDAFAFQKYKQSLMKDDILSNSESIISGDKLWDKKAINELTKNGSDIKGWSKMSSKYQYETPYGKGEVHYYQNKVTGEISNFDAKIKIIKSKKLWADKTKAEYYVLDVDTNFNVLGVRD